MPDARFQPGDVVVLNGHRLRVDRIDLQGRVLLYDEDDRPVTLPGDLLPDPEPREEPEPGYVPGAMYGGDVGYGWCYYMRLPSGRWKEFGGAIHPELTRPLVRLVPEGSEREQERASIVAWLRACLTCGLAHEPRVRPDGEVESWADPADGHVYLTLTADAIAALIERGAHESSGGERGTDDTHRCMACGAVRRTVRECCSAHGNSLCHGCYRRTHFVELCIPDCRDCLDEGLPVVWPAAPPAVPGGGGAEREFLAASVAVWREIDRLSAEPGGYRGLDESTALRRTERAAWERYRKTPAAASPGEPVGSGPKAYDVASTGPDAVIITVGGYGTDRIAHIAKGEEATPEQWADFKRRLIAGERPPAGDLLDAHHAQAIADADLDAAEKTEGAYTAREPR